MTDVAPDPAATPPVSTKLVNVPNGLTVLRLLAVPVFAVLLLQDEGRDDNGRIWATVAFVLAIITDWYDGMIARRTGQVGGPPGVRALPSTWWVTGVVTGVTG